MVFGFNIIYYIINKWSYTMEIQLCDYCFKVPTNSMFAKADMRNTFKDAIDAIKASEKDLWTYRFSTYKNTKFTEAMTFRMEYQLDNAASERCNCLDYCSNGVIIWDCALIHVKASKEVKFQFTPRNFPSGYTVFHGQIDILNYDLSQITVNMIKDVDNVLAYINDAYVQKVNDVNEKAIEWMSLSDDIIETCAKYGYNVVQDESDDPIANQLMDGNNASLCFYNTEDNEECFNIEYDDDIWSVYGDGDIIDGIIGIMAHKDDYLTVYFKNTKDLLYGIECIAKIRGLMKSTADEFKNNYKKLRPKHFE